MAVVCTQRPIKQNARFYTSCNKRCTRPGVSLGVFHTPVTLLLLLQQPSRLCCAATLHGSGSIPGKKYGCKQVSATSMSCRRCKQATSDDECLLLCCRSHDRFHVSDSSSKSNYEPCAKHTALLELAHTGPVKLAVLLNSCSMLSEHGSPFRIPAASQTCSCSVCNRCSLSRRMSCF